MANKTSNNQQKKETIGNGKRKKVEKKRSIVIVNRKAKATRPITLEVLVQEKKLK